ncbi:MAG: GTPase Era [Beijerinckiaceae bacterium]|nr:GTPase Era [Beijerinckiaceae bacterium]
MNSGSAARKRCGFTALIGAPNAGKSTLINRLAGTKVSIVSRKVQTTRGCVRGIAIEGEAQIILVDTPGIFAPRRRLDRAMAAAAWEAAGGSEVTALLVDACKGTAPDTGEILTELPEVSGTKILVLNKIDAVEPPRLLELAAKLNGVLPFANTFMISALRGHGVDKFRQELAALMPPGPWLYPEDQLSDAPLRLFAAEITREKLYERLHDELPYTSAVETTLWQDLPDGSARIEQTIYVTREGHKKIVIGEGGRTIKALGTAARKDIMDAAQQKVHLFLFVKVRANWADDPERYRDMGLHFPRD